MKKLSRINLLNLSQTELAEREKSMLKGGYDLPCVCIFGCACNYASHKEGPDESFYADSSTQSLQETRIPTGETGANLTKAPV